MSQPPSPVDYETPPPKPRGSFAGYIGGLIVGGLLTGAAVPLSLLLAFTVGREGQNPSGEMAGLLPGGAVILLTVLLSVNQKTRRFGLGMLTGIPLGILAVVAICGGLR